MKRIFLRLLLLCSIYITYKGVLFTILVLFSKFLPDVKNDTSYGSDIKSDQIILLGSSNTRYNFNYEALNVAFNDKSIHSVSTSTPFGMYYTLNKFIESKWNRKQNIVVIDIPYVLLARESFIPFHYVTIKMMTFKTAGKLFLKAPREFSNFIFRESLLNPVYMDNLKMIFKNYLNKKISYPPVDNNYLKINLAQDFGNAYSNCTTSYIKKQHYLEDVPLEDNYLKFLKVYIKTNIKSKVFFMYPEINKNNYNISNKTIEKFKEYFQPINSFESSNYNNEYMYNQWYHLNKCGADINTSKFIINLKKALSEKASNF